MKQPVKIAPSVRPPTAYDRLSENESAEGSKYLSLPAGQLTINKHNVRNTFKSLSELEKYTAEIGWPTDAFSGGVENPLDWIEENVTNSDEYQKQSFIRIVQLALSIDSEGQLQPVGAVREEGGYRILLGSTRVMACWLLGRKVDLQLMTNLEPVYELRAHLSENLDRENLTFAETADGYLRLFELLLEQGEIEAITRTEVMSQLGVSRTHALRWRSVLNKALEDDAYRKKVLSGSVSSITEAYSLTRPEADSTGEPEKGSGGDIASNQTGAGSGDPSLQGSESIQPGSFPNDTSTGDVNEEGREEPSPGNPSQQPSKKDSAIDLEEAHRISVALFKSEMDHHEERNPEIRARISQYFGHGSLVIKSKDDALQHIDWLLETVASNPST